MAELTPDEWAAAKELVADALEVDGDARAALLARLDDRPPHIAARVRALVAAATDAARPVPPVTGALLAAGNVPRDWTGAAIGGHRVVRFLARGGMGEVWEAEQQGTGRRVALKLLARDTRRDRSRFQLEGRLLGRLEHPAIAQVLDADVHRAEDGTRWPYLALELVDGERLTDHVRRAGLDRAAVLTLFVAVCRGVEHAHRKGVVHRDLKPDNILVAPAADGGDGPGRPKILDFGVAALTDATDRDASTRLTRAGDVLGTLAYMAPEQVEPGATAVDARTDVHALGAILFELLTGRLPFELTGRSLTESLVVLREGLAPRASSLDRSLRGDLDTILSTALAKEPARRYPSAAALADDLERFLAHEPIAAHPTSRLYRAAKFTRRHRRLVAATAAAAVLLLLGVAGTTVGLLRARSEVRHTLEVNAFLAEVLGAPSPEVLGRDVHFRDVLDAYAPAIDDRFGHRPSSAARLHGSVGWAYFDLGEKDRALAHLGRARDLLADALGPDAPRTLAATRALLAARMDLDEVWPGMAAEAEALARRARSAFGADAPEVVAFELDHALALAAEWDLEGAVERLRALLRRVESTAVDASPTDVDQVLTGLATTLNLAGDQVEALALYDRLVERVAERAGPRSPETLRHQASRAVTMSELARFDEALALCEALEEPVLDVFGADHPTTLSLRATYGTVLVGFGRYAEASAVFEAVAAARDRTLGPRHLDTLVTLNNLVACLNYQERWDESEPLLRELIDRADALPDDGGIGISARGLLANALSAEGRHAEARRVIEENVAGFEAIFGPDHPNTLIQRNNLARVLHEGLGRPDEAADILTAVVDGWRAALPDDRGTLRLLLWNLGRARADAGRFAAAEEALLAVDALAPDDPAGSVDRDAWRARLSALYEAWGRPAPPAEPAPADR